MRRDRILESWNEFSRKILNQGTPQIQRKEMRRAFYAGVAFILDKLIHDVTPGDEVAESDTQMLQDINDELRDFAQQMAKGVA